MTANSACIASMVSLDANFGGKRLVHCQHGVFLLKRPDPRFLSAWMNGPISTELLTALVITAL